MYMAMKLTPLRTSTYERPFTHEGNYLVNLCCFSLLTWGLECIDLLWLVTVGNPSLDGLPGIAKT